MERFVSVSMVRLVLLSLLYVLLDPVWMDGMVYTSCGLSYDSNGLLVNSPVWHTEDGRICLGKFKDAVMIECSDFSAPP